MKTKEQKIKFKTFCDSDLEMFEQLDLTEKEVKKWNINFISFEEFFDKSQKKINNLSL